MKGNNEGTIMSDKYTEDQHWFFKHIQGMSYLSELVKENPKIAKVIRSYSESHDPNEAKWQLLPLFSRTIRARHKKDER